MPEEGEPLAAASAARRMSRRAVLRDGTAIGVGAALATALPLSRRAAVAQTPSPAASPQVEPQARRRIALPQPKILKSANHELDLTLTCIPAVVDMNATQPVTTYTFDKVVPGYTWELNQGDTLKVKMVNKLPAMPPPPTMTMTRPHEWTWTNLHTHGLHVSPSGNADNIFLSIPPGGTQQYEYHLPADHPSGIFWYHPHRHGGVAQQVRAGMAGMIIVRGDIDQVEEVKAAKEQVMVLQAIELGKNLQLLDPIPDPTPTQSFYPRSHILYTVNGVLNPTITMYPGEVQRWRLLNAAEGKFMSLRLEGHPFHVLAWDGLTLAKPDDVDLVLLSSGNRVELLVKAAKPGIYHLILTPGSSQKPDIPGMPASTNGATATSMPMAALEVNDGLQDIPGELVVQSILTLAVAGSGPEMSLPTGLPVWDPPILPIAKKRDFKFTVTRGPGESFIDFGIDNKAYDPNRPPYQAKLGTAEEWTLTNAIDMKYMRHAHVYHIHVNPFKITKVNGVTLDRPFWRDTYVLSGGNGDSVTWVSNFVDYTGKFVEHCHVLTHEDLGMMAAVEVVS